ASRCTTTPGTTSRATSTARAESSSAAPGGWRRRRRNRDPPPAARHCRRLTDRPAPRVDLRFPRVPPCLPRRHTAVRTAPLLEDPVPSSVRHVTSRHRRRLLGIVALVLGCVLVQLPPIRAVAVVNPCGPPVLSVIACENSLPGTPPSDWQVGGTGDASIQG